MQHTKPHEGRNVKRIREILGVKQEALPSRVSLRRDSRSPGDKACFSNLFHRSSLQLGIDCAHAFCELLYGFN